MIIRKYFQEKRKGWGAPSTSSPANSVMKTKLDIRTQCVKCSFTNIKHSKRPVINWMCNIEKFWLRISFIQTNIWAQSDFEDD